MLHCLQVSWWTCLQVQQRPICPKCARILGFLTDSCSYAPLVAASSVPIDSPQESLLPQLSCPLQGNSAGCQMHHCRGMRPAAWVGAYAGAMQAAHRDEPLE